MLYLISITIAFAIYYFSLLLFFYFGDKPELPKKQPELIQSSDEGQRGPGDGGFQSNDLIDSTTLKWSEKVDSNSMVDTLQGVLSVDSLTGDQDSSLNLSSEDSLSIRGTSSEQRK